MIKLILKQVLCCIIPVLCVAEPIKFLNCAQGSDLLSVDISPCPVQPCSFKHGMNVTVKAEFNADANSNKLKSEVFGIVAGIPVPYTLPNSDGCKSSNIICPVTKTQKYTFQGSFPVLKTYPIIRLEVKWDLKDENGNLQFCFIFPMEIKD